MHEASSLLNITEKIATRTALACPVAGAGACVRLALLLFLILLTGCTYESGEGSLSAQSGALEKVRVTPQSVYLWPVSQSTLLTAVGTSSGGTLIPNAPPVTWKSNDIAVATVDSSGRVTAMAAGTTTIVATVGSITSSVTVVVAPPGAVTGTVRYQDKPYSKDKFELTTPAYKAVRFAKVDLLDSAGAIVKSTQTDAAGVYRIEGAPVAEGQRIRVLAESDAVSGFEVRVLDNSAAVYAVSRDLTFSGATASLDLDFPYLNAPAGAFNVYDVMISGMQFGRTLTGAASPALNVYWEKGVASGTQYCTGPDPDYCPHGAGIYVSDDRSSGDTDEYDDDVLWHEFGHFLVDKYSRDDSEGGCHFLTNTDLDMRLAWSEGWGDFFAVAVKRWLAADLRRAELLSSMADVSSSTYIDTADGRTSLIIELATVGSTYSYATNEVSIARILWDVSAEYQMESVWGVLTQEFKAMPSTSPVNLEAFWNRWRAQRQSSATELGVIRNILRARQVFYEEDGFEPDDTPNASRLLTLGQDETHYLYRNDGSVDKDVVAFVAEGGRSYLVETSGLRNGADTEVTVLSPQKAPLTVNGVLVANDDFDEALYFRDDSACGQERVRNTPTALASKTTFVAPVSGTYFVEISTTKDPEPHPSAGNYGTYAIRVTQQ